MKSLLNTVKENKIGLAKELIKEFHSYVKRNKSIPTIGELGRSREQFKSTFGSYKNLKDAFEREYPNLYQVAFQNDDPKYKIEQEVLKFILKTKRYPNYSELSVSTESIRGHFKNKDILINNVVSKNKTKLSKIKIQSIDEYNSEKHENSKESIINGVKLFIKEHKRIPLLTELDASEKTIQKYFSGGKTTLIENLKVECPELFKETMIDYEHFNSDRKKILEKDIRKSNKYVITTIIAGNEIHEQFHKNLKFYAEKNGAELLYFVCENKLLGLEDEFKESNILFDETIICDTLFASNIQIKAKQINPFTGIDKLPKDNQSMIVGTPKQHFQTLPVIGDDETIVPRLMVSTGSISMPYYEGKKYIQKRTDYIAERDHTVGALIVEVEKDRKHFHWRHLESNMDGSFIDLGTSYHKGKTKNVGAEAIILGDWHSGETDPVAKKVMENVTKKVKPKKAFMHDLFNGKSINHHEDGDYLQMAKKVNNNEHLLEPELEATIDELDYLTSLYKEVFVVRSNHDLFLDGYLKQMKFIKDSANFKIGSELFQTMVKGAKNPLEAYCTDRVKDSKNITWLSENDRYVVEGWITSIHGHKGINGAKGSPTSYKKLSHKVIVGHTHSPYLIPGVAGVGTMTHSRLGYNNGASTWMQSSALIYKGGAIQFVNVINGKYSLGE